MEIINAWDTLEDVQARELWFKSLLYGELPVVYSPQRYFISAYKNEWDRFGLPIIKPNYKLFKQKLKK